MAKKALKRLACLYDNIVIKYGKDEADRIMDYVATCLSYIHEGAKAKFTFTFIPHGKDLMFECDIEHITEEEVDVTGDKIYDVFGKSHDIELDPNYEYDFDDEDDDDEDDVERPSKEGLERAFADLIKSRDKMNASERQKNQERAYLLGKDEFSKRIADVVSNDSSKYAKTFVSKEYNADIHKANTAAIERNVERVAKSMERARCLNLLINKYRIHDLLAVSLKCIYEAAEYLTDYSVNAAHRFECAAELICCARYNINRWCEEEKANHCMRVDSDVYSFAHKSCNDDCLLEAAVIDIFAATCAPSTDICEIYINAAFISLTDVEKQLRGIDPKDVLNNVI